MDEDDKKLIVDIEALEQLRKAVDACRATNLTREEILQVLRPLFTGNDVFVEGDLFDHLEDDDASKIIALTYDVLPQGATFAFGVRRSTENEVYELCEDAGISRENAYITLEGSLWRVAITKYQ